MKKLFAALCVLLCVGFTLSAAVNVKADDLPAGMISSDSEFNGLTVLPGTGTAEVTASADAAAGYGSVLTISGDAALSVQAAAGETISAIGPAPADGGTFALAIASDSGSMEIAESEAADGGAMLVTHPVEEDGLYMISSAYGDPVSICEITVE